MEKVKLGPDPILLSRKEVDALYETLEAVINALEQLKVHYIVTGGTLLGAVRQHSLLFCDDDVDVAILTEASYQHVSQHLAKLLGPDYQYAIKPWEGSDKIRPKHATSVFIDLFCIRRYDNMEELRKVIGRKRNGQEQSEEYIQNIISTIQTSAYSQNNQGAPLYPFWHFNTRKAVEMWPKEVYRESELFPLCAELKFGPLVGVKGPRMPVLLLKRAFGSDCFEVYYQSVSHKDASEKKHVESGESLPPLLMGGGAWEGGKRVMLEDQHYLPMQPVLRAKRRPTQHGKEQLFQYLEEQSKLEEAWLQEEATERTVGGGAKLEGRPNRTVYMDGVFDLFHVGHLEAIRQCAQLGKRVIIGVTGAVDAADYKRPPIISEDNRVAVVGALKEVDDVVCPCPLVVTEEFMEEHGIDLVVHGFANDADAERQELFFDIPIKSGRFKRISYYNGLSTTDIIEKIRALPEPKEHVPEPPLPNPKWFGATLAAATDNAATIPFDPFPLSLRQVVEPHIRKATTCREQALGAVRTATGALRYDEILSQFTSSGLVQERNFEFDTVLHPLRSAFLHSAGLPTDTDLSHLHETAGTKDSAFHSLTKDPSHFQLVFDNFVHNVCAPHLASLHDCDEIYYQAFPCIRVIQPNEFSIAPHSDVAYGHHPCSINFYVPLTEIGGASALFLESRPGSEDWHPIEGYYGFVKHFAGAVCAHWTAENKTSLTRVSIDFRLIPGPLFRALACGGQHPGGKLDVYRQKGGYYSCSRKFAKGGTLVWRREGSAEMLQPDTRVGFPWTVRNWDKFLKKNAEKTNAEN